VLVHDGAVCMHPIRDQHQRHTHTHTHVATPGSIAGQHIHPMVSSVSDGVAAPRDERVCNIVSVVQRVLQGVHGMSGAATQGGLSLW
jgi:hypothetical protein